MISLKAVQASNAGLRALPNITALFVGGTSGIGQSALRQLAQETEKPTAYIVGRNESKARPFLAELRQLNPDGQFNFVEADVSLIRNVDFGMRPDSKTRKISQFFVHDTRGYLPWRQKGEGIDYLFALRCYSRMRFIRRLLPLLEAAGPSRVISVYGGGMEFPIDTNDLDFKHNFSLLNSYKHSIT